MNLFWSPLSLPSPQGGERVAEGRERGWFMERHHGDPLCHRDGGCMGKRSVFPRHQCQPLPPPDNLSIFFTEAKQVARGLRRVGDEFQNFLPVLERRSRGVERPIEVGSFERS